MHSLPEQMGTKGFPFSVVICWRHHDRRNACFVVNFVSVCNVRVSEWEVQMRGKVIRLNFTVLWLLAVATGLAENWILRGFGLNATHRIVVITGFLPLMIFLVVMGVFQQLRLRRE
jgi:hypothetical protein